MNPEISIIVPVFNSEKWLSRCIDSILGQSFSDFELIIVNDGSTDQSGEICDQYALKDNRIKVIHIKNGGVSNARNTGMKQAQGKYLIFCDSDDYAERDWCNHLYDAAVENRNSLPVCGVRDIDQTGITEKEFIKVSSNKEIICKKKFSSTLKQGFLRMGVWNKIYDKNLIDNNSLYFNINMKRGEDVLFNLSYLSHVDSFITIPYIGYNHICLRQISLMNTYRKDLYVYIVKGYQAWQNYFDKHSIVDKEELEACATLYFYNFIGVMQNTFDKRNPDNLIKKLKYNNQILNSKEFIECLDLADLSKEDKRYIYLLKTNNYYLVWLAEQAYKIKSHFKK